MDCSLVELKLSAAILGYARRDYTGTKGILVAGSLGTLARAKMRVLVTGGSGYVGSHAVRELHAAGHEALIYDNLSTGHRRFCDGYKLIEADIADQAALAKALLDIDAVMHFAASAYVGESVINPRKYFRNNIESALLLLDAVLASKVRLFIFSSSCATYGVPQSLPIAESSPREPINPYGATKLFFEHALAAYSVAHGLRSVSLRYFNAAGAHAGGSIGELHIPETHLIPLALKAALGVAPPLKIFGQNLSTPDGTCIRDYIHVSDLGRAHVLALEYLAKGGETSCLNLGTGEGTSVAQLVAAAETIIGRKVPHSYTDPRPGDPPVLFADPTKAKFILGWRPQHDLSDILHTAWNWELKLQASGYHL
jgi:UDP-glucose-4-epimerase GalE